MDAMKRKLVELRDELERLAETGDASAAVVELDQARVGRLSRMDAMQAQAMAQASGERRAAMLREIGAALRRIELGEFGFCEECGEPINPKRLEIDPTSRLCISCASAAE
jgi:DnaK suppressor protein